MHPLPDTTGITLPEHFNDPFRYRPHPLVEKAAKEVLGKVADLGIEEGKMLGVLIVQDKEGRLGYLAGFSGSIGNRSIIEGFVPPIFDLLVPDGHFKKGEAELNSINQEISELCRSEELSSLKQRLEESESLKEDDITRMKARSETSGRPDQGKSAPESGASKNPHKMGRSDQFNQERYQTNRREDTDFEEKKDKDVRRTSGMDLRSI